MENGGDLRSYMTQRFASSMVFMSLLLGAELNVLFNSAAVTTSMRRELFAENFWTVEFWAGITILVSVILTILSLISTFTVWGMVSSVSDVNAHCILRSSIGQYVAELPGRFIVTAVYSFLMWVTLFFFLLLPVGFWSILLMITTAALFFHVVVVFSAFGRIIMHTGAMGSDRIFDEATEKRLLPHTLHTSLFEKAKAELARNTSIMRQYRRKRPSSVNSSNVETDPCFADVAEPRKRADSSVRFADTLWTSITPRDSTTTPLSDIASIHEGAETLSSQVSGASSSDKVERPKRPPRPTAVNASEGNGFVDVLGGSSHSLKEWLKSRPSKLDAAKTGSKKSGQSDGKRHDSPNGCTSDNGHGAKPRYSMRSMSPVQFAASSNEQPRSGRSSSSPIDDDTSGHSADSPFWQHLSSIPLNKPLSENSSMHGSTANFQRQLTEEETFDEEYGELFDAEEAEVQSNNADENNTVDSQGYEVEYGHEHSDLELGETVSEQQRLLPDGDTHSTSYSAVDTMRNQDKTKLLHDRDS